MIKIVPTCKLECQMGIDGNASGSSPEHYHHHPCNDGDDDDDDHCHDNDDHDHDDDDKPQLRPLQSVGLCNLNSLSQEPVSPADKGAAVVF